jgi:hypothetical protein
MLSSTPRLGTPTIQTAVTAMSSVSDPEALTSQEQYSFYMQHAYALK